MQPQKIEKQIITSNLFELRLVISNFWKRKQKQKIKTNQTF
jgi:hypothetical protein